MGGKTGVLCAWWALSVGPAALAACSSEDSAATTGSAGSAGQSDAAASDGATTDAGSDAPQTPCDFHTQDCAGTTEKCSIVQQPGRYASVCVPRQAEHQAGEECQRTALGYDDCAAGNLCSPAALQGTGSMVCRKICDASAQCATPERCYHFSLAQPETYGMCVPVCRFFETDCGPNRHCLLVADADGSAFPICDDHGTVGEGGACVNANECGQGMACARVSGSASCRLYCDPAHPCAIPTDACNPLGLAGFPGLGVCLPP